MSTDNKYDDDYDGGAQVQVVEEEAPEKELHLLTRDASTGQGTEAQLLENDNYNNKNNYVPEMPFVKEEEDDVIRDLGDGNDNDDGGENGAAPKKDEQIEEDDSFYDVEQEEEEQIMEGEESVKSDWSDWTQNLPTKKTFAMILLGTTVLLLLIAVIVRLALSRKDSLKTDPRRGMTLQEEADYCQEKGCTNPNCLRIGACYDGSVVSGRPFREALFSAPLLAQTSTTCSSDDDCPWSSTTMEHAQQTLELNVVSTWADRGVGEHASIASFAAFVIALLTHQAPPDLIEDALKAASDELRHAQLAFGRAAAANGGVGLGPTALPASRLDFSQDLTKLAQAVVQEGCIDETLSALFLAHQSEQETGDKELLWSIAKDEARHSQLAWRTLMWVCSKKDDTACRTTMETILSPNRIASAVQERWGQEPQKSTCISPIETAWQRIADHLIDSITNGRLQDCPTYLPSASAVDALSMDIIREFCRSAMAA